jgi:hypothetical protein
VPFIKSGLTTETGFWNETSLLWRTDVSVVWCPSAPPLAPAAVTLYITLVFASESYRNCLETERLLMKDIRNGDISPRDRAVCANALDRILERKRILRMKPAPKAVDADKYQEQRKARRYNDAPMCSEIDESTAPTEMSGG